jgi:peptidoglycan-N-acetylglucosamine deacetylase
LKGVDRRAFIKLSAVAAPLLRWPMLRAESSKPEVALTFDDPTTEGGVGLSWQQINERILTALDKGAIKSILFVCGKRVDNDSGSSLIAAWDKAGHGIGNHSYSHLYFNASGEDSSNGSNVRLADFEADSLKNEPLIRKYSHFTRLFRYPYFKEGDTVEKRDGMRSFLRLHGYRIGRATIDASDWAINARLERRAKQNAKADFSAYGDFLCQHIWERAQFYNSLALRVLNHPVRHTLLLHHSALNALFLPRLIEMFVEKGWTPIDAHRAYEDPIYELQPNILPAGESLIWALAKQNGKFDSELRYPGEDEVYENPRMDALKL